MRFPWARGRRADADIDQALAVVTWDKAKPPARAVSSPPPGPALTPWERGVLASLAATPVPAQGTRNGRELAAAARQLLPGPGGTQIGRVILQAYWQAASFHRAMPPGVAMTATLDALGAATLALTAPGRVQEPGIPAGEAVPPAARLPLPGPVPNEHEREALAAIERSRVAVDPQAVRNAERIADGLRLRFPTVDDTTIGLIVLEIARWFTAAMCAAASPAKALKVIDHALGLCAEEMTRLARQEETSDGHP